MSTIPPIKPLLRLILLLCLCLPAVEAVAVEEAVSIGVLAKRGDQHTVQRWQPTADYLSERIPGRRFVVVPLDFEEIDQAVADGKVDFLLANSGIYVDFEVRYGISRIATMRNRDGDEGYTLFGGVIFTRADREEINTLEDIEGRRFAAVKGNSLGGFLMAWRELETVGINPRDDTRLAFLGTHDAVVYAVLNGQADVGTVRTDTLERMQAEDKIELSRVKVLNPKPTVGFDYLLSTRLYPEWPFARLRHTPAALGNQVAAALLHMESNHPATLAGQISGWTVPRNYQPVHELMRELHVGPYADLGKISLQDLLRHYWHWLLLTLAVLLLLGSATLYVSRLNLRLRRTEAELIDARDNLAQKVRERTAELEESHRRLERISRDWNDAFDAIEDPIFIHDEQMHIVQANPAYCERAGLPLETMLGKPYYRFFPRLDKPLPACGTFPEKLHKEGDELQLDNGEVFLSRSFGIRRADNTVVHALHILEDVTDVRRAEARRRTLSRAVEQAGEGVLILDRGRRPIYCNPAMSRLLQREPLPKQHVPDLKAIDALVAPHFAEALLRLFAEAEQQGATASDEMELALPGGRTRPAVVTVGMIRDEEEVLDGYVLSVLDLSEIKRAESALTYRIGFESLVASVASRLVNVEPDTVDAEVEKTLQQLGEFAATDRAYLFGYERDSDSITNSHEWVAQGVSQQLANLQAIPFSSLPWLKERLLTGREVKVTDVDELPEAAAAERAEFRHEEIRSLLLVPLHYGGRFAGFIGFDNVRHQRDWAEEDMRLLRVAGEIIINTLGRVSAARELQKSESSLAEAQQIAHMGNWDWDIKTGELTWSDEIYRIFGLTPQQFGATYEAFLDSVHPADRSQVINAVNRAVAGESDYAIDHRVVRPDGSERIVHEVGEVHLDDDGEPQRMIGTVQDVTEQRLSEYEMRRLNRALRTLSLCNTTMVHAEDEQTLMEEICRILIDNGGYRLAWVGYAEHDGQETIRPVAHAGLDHGFLDSLHIRWSEGEAVQHPAARAICEGNTVIVRSIADSRDDDCGATWREAALERGYASVIALPLISEGETLGVITIDAGEDDAFDEAERQLLKEMAGDLAFGIRTLRGREQQRQAEEALRQTEQRYEELYENAPNAYVSVSTDDGRLLQFNKALGDMLGYDRETLGNMRVFDLYADTRFGLKKARKIFSRFIEGEGVRDEELQMRHADGHPVWVSVSVDPVRDEQGRVVESRSMVIDISARKRAEEERGHFAERLQRSLLQTIRAIALTIEKRDPYTAGHQERVAELAVAIGRELGLDEPALEGLRLGALIHDIGKVSVPAEILNRPGKLEPEMFSIIKTHPMSGYEIISGIDFPWPLADMVVQHHERLDGSGYPHGLKGEEILFESRILAVADVIEAMASHRPYRAALGVEVALEEIVKGKGQLYDEKVVDSCLHLFRDGGMDEWLSRNTNH